MSPGLDVVFGAGVGALCALAAAAGARARRRRGAPEPSRIAALVQEIADRGDWTRRLDPGPVGETGELVAQINRLLAAVQEAVDELRMKQRALACSQQELAAINSELERSRDTLESQVRERTMELEEAKRSLAGQVDARTAELRQTNGELQAKMHELELLNRVMMGREDRILELKAELRALRAGVSRVGRPPGGPSGS
ncbi:MAG TPA: hypothetical protein VGB20_00955 [bacterium]